MLNFCSWSRPQNYFNNEIFPIYGMSSLKTSSCRSAANAALNNNWRKALEKLLTIFESVCVRTRPSILSPLFKKPPHQERSLLICSEAASLMSVRKNRILCLTDAFCRPSIVACSTVTAKREILYSAKFSQVFHFVNFQSFAKIFKRKCLTPGMQCVRTVNLWN